jgi:hypothetical protein
MGSERTTTSFPRALAPGYCRGIRQFQSNPDVDEKKPLSVVLPVKKQTYLLSQTGDRRGIEDVQGPDGAITTPALTI